MAQSLRRHFEWSDPVAARDHAIKAGRLSTDSNAPNYFGDYQYRGSQNGKDVFRHRETRRRLP
jgi:hypothetical protein